MKRTVLFGVIATVVGIGTASLLYVNRVRQNAALDPEKSIDNLVDYCQTKVDQLDSLLKSLPRETAKSTAS